ncbi:molybdopterin molybdochelatase [Alteromonadaceae bacterium Bs31]|nr:molybdopterin molybdochelatase [Alteromonadaceae bacterium Bs31]
MSSCDAPGLLPLEQAQVLLNDSLRIQANTETIELTQTLDRVLAVNIYSPHNIPNYDNSAMDGYALNVDLSDTSQPLTVVGKSFAGKAYDGKVGVGECVRIMTGAKVPSDCNCVAMQENTQANGGKISLTQAVKTGENIRLTGNDVKKNSLVLVKGKRLDPLDIGMLASLGIANVSVFKKIRVAIFSTGDEIIPLGEPLKDGFIYDSNRHLIRTCLQRMNLDVKDYGVIEDNPRLIEETFIDASNCCDAIISSGGVSVGEADYTRDILHKLGDITFYKLAMKPGKPFAFGSIGKAHFFGLPGNPVSAAVTFHQLALPALSRMAGELNAEPLIIKMPTATALRKRPGRADFQRGHFFKAADGTLCVEAIRSQSSGALSSMVTANCYIVLEQARGAVAVGELVDVVPFDRYFS